MKTIERYVFTSFLTSFALAFLVLTFIVTIFLMVQIVGLILDGVSVSLIGQFALVSFPETLHLTCPLALLVSSLLVFSRLSTDSEVAAMRACGINMMSVMKWPILFALLCTLIGAWTNNEITPRGHEVRRKLKSRVTVGTGLDVLKPGLWIDDFPKVKFYFRRKEGNWLYDIHVKDFSNSKFVRTIQASKALVFSEGRDVSLDLYDMKVEPVDEEHPGMARVMRYQYVMKDALKESSYSKKTKDLRFRELLASAGDLDREAKAADDPQMKDSLLKKRSEVRLELSKRFVFSFASICFVLVGIPLGIQTQRRESYIGWVGSALIALQYYLVVMGGMCLEKNYHVHPEYLIWIPVAVCGLLSVRFIRKSL